MALGLCCLLAITSCERKKEQSQTLSAYSKQENKILKALYFYPTTIRMLSKILGDENGQALSEIKKARLFFSWSDDDKLIGDEVKTLKSGVKDEGFEMLMQMTSSGNKIDVYLLDDEIDDYVLFVDGDQGTFVFEILGNLSPSSIRDISQLDMSKMMDLFDLQKPAEEEPLDSLNTKSK